VRVRHKGFPDQIITLGSLEAAEQLLLRIQSERASGLVVDYSSARRVTMAQLVERYLKEECPKHKGASIEGYTLRGMLADSRGELERALKERGSNDSNGRRTSPIRARREPRQGLNGSTNLSQTSCRRTSKSSSSIASSKFRRPQSTAKSTCWQP